MTGERDYVLGTGDEEIDRLGLQHRTWRSRVLDCWRRAGVGPGSRVADVGAGPGFATVDLAEIVGPSGGVVAFERSARFLAHAREACRVRGLAHVAFRELDLVERRVDDTGLDAAWCRWVASFVASRDALVANVARLLRPGGVAAFHEYADYGTWRLAPRAPAHEEFVRAVMASWRDAGGEPDVALELPGLLERHGLRVREIRPHVMAVRPDEPAWQWPASFVDVNLHRLVETGRVDAAFAQRVREEMRAASAAPESLMITPLVLEILAERKG